MGPSKKATYRIRIQGHLEPSWSDRLADMTITQAYTAQKQPITIMVGMLDDQSALAGVLNTLHGINCNILTVENIDEGTLDQGK